MAIIKANANLAHAASVPTNASLPIYRTSTPLWQRFFVFAVGFSIQFNALIGGNGAGASATGGYGYRLTDLIALFTLGLLCLFAIAPHRIFPLGLFGLIAAVIFLSPILSPEDRTSILGKHYLLYCFFALYVVVILNELSAIDWFCWGLIVGLLATLPIFALELNYGAILINLGLVPGYSRLTVTFTSALPRLNGFWGHPNEAGHVAALTAAAPVYFAVVRHRFLPIAIAAVSYLMVFYFTACRGGLIVAGATLIIPFIFVRGGFNLRRMAFVIALIAIASIIVSNSEFITSRFQDDPNASNNIDARIDSTLSGLQVIFTHPLGVSMEDFFSLVFSNTGGVYTAHNGFLFFGGTFGLLPLTLLLAAIATSFRIHDDTDVFFATLGFQLSLSFLFETLSASYSYAFIICVILSRAFIKTRVGGLLRARTVRNARRFGRAFNSLSTPPAIGNPLNDSSLRR